MMADVLLRTAWADNHSSGGHGTPASVEPAASDVVNADVSKGVTLMLPPVSPGCAGSECGIP